MATTQDQPAQAAMMPGRDSSTPVKNLHQNIAQNLNFLQNQPTDPGDLMPPTQSSPLLPNWALMEKSGAEVDLEDMMAGEKGLPRTEPAKNFLGMLLLRLKKQNPQAEIIKEEK